MSHPETRGTLRPRETRCRVSWTQLNSEQLFKRKRIFTDSLNSGDCFSHLCGRTHGSRWSSVITTVVILGIAVAAERDLFPDS